MTQPPLFDLISVFDQLAASIGGHQTAGSMLWPDMDPIEAGKKFSRCINPNTKEVLHPEKVAELVHAASRQRCYAYHDYLARLTFTTFEPQSVEQEMAKAHGEFDMNLQRQAELIERMRQLMELGK